MRELASWGDACAYFNWTEELDAKPIRNRTSVIPGVDIRGVGGFVRAGGPYKVVNNAPIADAPAWLIELARKRSNGKTGTSTTDNAEGYPASPLTEDDPLFDVRVGEATNFLKQ